MSHSVSYLGYIEKGKAFNNVEVEQLHIGEPKDGFDIAWNGADALSFTPVTSTDVLKINGQHSKKVTSSTVTGAATLTAAQLLGGVISYTGAGANVALPAAADMVAGVPDAAVGDTFMCYVFNSGSGTATITLGGSTLYGAGAIAQNKGAILIIHLTNVTASSEAYSVTHAVSV
jgi:uncharacterized Zn-binding protein involved in type VI secretion